MRRWSDFKNRRDDEMMRDGVSEIASSIETSSLGTGVWFGPRVALITRRLHGSPARSCGVRRSARGRTGCS